VGRMVIPVGTYQQSLRVIDKLEDGSLRAASVRPTVPATCHSRTKDAQMRGI